MKMLSLKKYVYEKIGTQYTLRVFGAFAFVLFTSRLQKCGWVRFFGVGVKWKHKDNPLTFSERYGAAKVVKVVKVGRYNVGFLEYSKT